MSTMPVATTRSYSPSPKVPPSELLTPLDPLPDRRSARKGRLRASREDARALRKAPGSVASPARRRRRVDPRAARTRPLGGSAPDLATARDLIARARSIAKVPADYGPLIHYLVASSVLQRFLATAPPPSNRDAAEAYYLLGLAETHVGDTYWVSQADMYLETAIRLAPKEPFALRGLSRARRGDGGQLHGLARRTAAQIGRRASRRAARAGGREVALDLDAARRSRRRNWESSILPALERYIRSPTSRRPSTPTGSAHGHMERAVAADRRVGARRSRSPGCGSRSCASPAARRAAHRRCRATAPTPVLLYGHLDKQPRDGRLARGPRAVDAGAARRQALRPRRRRRRLRRLRLAHRASRRCSEQGVPHARCVVLIEACEESGSFDLPAYIEHSRERIGTPSLVVCLDSGCGNYEQLWCTTSLRGLVGGTLRVDVLDEGVHSGDASGIVPSSFRIAAPAPRRASRTSATGEILPRRPPRRDPRRAPSRRRRPRPQVLGDERVRAASRSPAARGR